jgi:ERF superfamily
MTNAAIYASMAQCVADIGVLGINKANQNSFQKFNYRSVDQVLAAFNKVFAKNKVFTIQQTRNVEKTVIGQDAKNTNIWSISFDLYIFFYSGIDGSTLPEPIIISGINDGKDCSKLTGQLTSYLVKEALFKTFFVPTEGADDLDSRDSSGVPLKVTEALDANKHGVRWKEPPNDAKQALEWAAQLLSISVADAQKLLDKVSPDANGRKFAGFTTLVKERWQNR